jgi:hypothetical protein
VAKRKSETDGGRAPDRLARAVERLGIVAGALAANQLGEADLPTKAKWLRSLGFSNTEIASVLSSTSNSVAVALHRGKARGLSKKPASRKRS